MGVKTGDKGRKTHTAKQLFTAACRVSEQLNSLSYPSIFVPEEE
jgi:hypothetical protein